MIRLFYIICLKSLVSSGDEIAYVDTSFKIIFNHLNPDFFIHPSLHFYVVSLLYFCLFLIGNFIGFFASNSDFIVFFLERNDVFIITSRLASMIFNLGSIYLVYRIGKNIWDEKIGLLAAFIFSTIPMSIEIARNTSQYSTTSFFILLSVLFILRLFNGLSFRNIILASAVFGLALSSDYYALILVPIYMAILLFLVRGQKNAVKVYSMLIFFLIAFIVFVSVNVYIFLNLQTFLRDVITQSQAALYSEYGHIYNKLFYFRFLLHLPYLFLLIFFVVGFFLFFKKLQVKEIILLFFPIINIFLFSFSKVQLPHYIAHAMPFFALISSRVVVDTSQILKINNKNAFFISIILPFYLFLCVLDYKPRIYNSTALEAKSWFEKNIPQGSKVLINPGTIPFGASRLAQVIYEKELYNSSIKRYLQKHPNENYEFLTSNLVGKMIGIVHKEKIQYIVLSVRDYDRQATDWLSRNAVFIKGFGNAGKYNQNKWFIRIYRVFN